MKPNQYLLIRTILDRSGTATTLLSDSLLASRSSLLLDLGLVLPVVAARTGLGVSFSKSRRNVASASLRVAGLLALAGLAGTDWGSLDGHGFLYLAGCDREGYRRRK